MYMFMYGRVLRCYIHVHMYVHVHALATGGELCSLINCYTGEHLQTLWPCSYVLWLWPLTVFSWACRCKALAHEGLQCCPCMLNIKLKDEKRWLSGFTFAMSAYMYMYSVHIMPIHYSSALTLSNGSQLCTPSIHCSIIHKYVHVHNCIIYMYQMSTFVCMTRTHTSDTCIYCIILAETWIKKLPEHLPTQCHPSSLQHTVSSRSL